MNDILDTLRTLAPHLPADPAGLEAARVRLALALDGESSAPTVAATPPTDDGEPPAAVVVGAEELARRRARRRIAALALAASAVAGVIVVTQLAAPTAGAMAWSRTGTVVDGERGQELAAECAAGWADADLTETAAGVAVPTAADFANPILVLAEERGNTSLVTAEVGGWTVYCSSGEGGGAAVIAPAAGESFADPAGEDADVAFLSGHAAMLSDETVDPETGEYLYATFEHVLGTVAPGVTDVTITTPDGTEIPATVGNGRFLAWWPVDGVTPETWEPGAGTTLTWTYQDGSTGGPTDLGGLADAQH